jgi:Spy/CpxP family protein refolding chaperone
MIQFNQESNMNKLTLIHFMLASSVALGLPLAASARPMMDGPEGCCSPMQMMGERGMPGGKHLPPFLRELKLSETQRDRIFDLMQAKAPAMREQAKAMRKSQMELRQLGMSDEYSEARAKVLADANAQAMARMGQLQASASHQVYQLLTPEQRKQMEELQARQQPMDMP